MPGLTLCGLETSRRVTMANIGDPDEMPHKAEFHQGLHCLQRQKIFRERKIIFLKILLWAFLA